MTDENTPSSSVTPTPVAAPVAPKAPKPKKVSVPAASMSGLGRTMIAVALILALLAVAGAAALGYWMQMERVQSLETLTNLRNDINNRAAALNDLRNQLDQVANQVKQDRQAIQKGTSARDDLASRMAALEKQVAIVTGSHRIDWMLKEIEHFIQLAERRTSLLGDAKGALALLQEADGVARDLNEPAARGLREALVRDTHALKIAAETSVDVDGIFLRISRLVDRVPQLNIPRYELMQTEPLTQEGAQPADGIELFWGRFVGFLESLVRYQKHEKQKPVLLTSQRDYLAQSLVLLLEQGQLALLRGDNNAYRLSLNEARERINHFQQIQPQEIKLFNSELEALAAIKLQPPMPTLEESVRAVQVFREFWAKEKIERERARMKLEMQQADSSADAGEQL